jgi:hypothetical protein
MSYRCIGFSSEPPPPRGTDAEHVRVLVARDGHHDHVAENDADVVPVVCLAERHVADEVRAARIVEGNLNDRHERPHVARSGANRCDRVDDKPVVVQIGHERGWVRPTADDQYDWWLFPSVTSKSGISGSGVL